MSDRDLWLVIRRALLMIVRAIEHKYLFKVGDYSDNNVARVDIDNV